ncbi:inosine triphosphate pyrophosphatase-like protein [Phlyctochytrium arcticum]|nr:inosine triphosphate pyrophosphatase-like protein [Phlyctochytrium arcticum]
MPDHYQCNHSFLQSPSIAINTSNPIKLAEFQSYLPLPLTSTSLDLPEPSTPDPFTIVQYKASQFSSTTPTLIDDVSLDIPGLSIGTNVKWMLGQLPTLPHGTKALFTCILGIRHEDHVHMYRSEIQGRIVQPPRGDNVGFRAYFEPDGCGYTLSERTVPECNPRYLAVREFLEGRPTCIRDVMEHWGSDFQDD